jgi:hypothetical protein
VLTPLPQQPGNSFGGSEIGLNSFAQCLPKGFGVGFRGYETVPGCFVDAESGGAGEGGGMMWVGEDVVEPGRVLEVVGGGGLKGAVAGDEEGSPKGQSLRSGVHEGQWWTYQTIPAMVRVQERLMASRPPRSLTMLVKPSRCILTALEFPLSYCH